MNEDQIAGSGRDLGGRIKETAGDLLGDRDLRAGGLADQLGGKAQKAVGAAREFTKSRPFAATALAAVLGVALLNTLRGKK